jgi:hypothetical protein
MHILIKELGMYDGKITLSNLEISIAINRHRRQIGRVH